MKEEFDIRFPFIFSFWSENDCFHARLMGRVWQDPLGPSLQPGSRHSRGHGDPEHCGVPLPTGL